MSKFFFKGRQDARQNHVTSGYKNNASQKTGSKKFPLTLVVTNSQRQEEVEQWVIDAGLFADIQLDERDGAVESIAELTAVLNKGATVKQEKLPARNEPCSCGSGKKFKKCCALTG